MPLSKVVRCPDCDRVISLRFPMHDCKAQPKQKDFTFVLRGGFAVVLKLDCDFMRVKPSDAEWVVQRLNEGAHANTLQAIYGV